MDTFNFSFFDDKPQESEKDTETTSSTNAASENEVNTDNTPAVADDDPFGFSAFATDQSETDSDEENPQSQELNFDLSDESSLASAQEGDFDFDSLETTATKNTKSDIFPNLVLDPAPSTTDTRTIEGLDDIPTGEDDNFSGLDFLQNSSDEVAPETSAVEAVDADDSFDNLTTQSLDDFAPVAEQPEPSFDLDSFDTLTEPESEPPTAPEVATVLPPVEPEEIRASVTPAVFLTPPVAPDVAEPTPESEVAEPVVVTPIPTPATTPSEPKAKRFLTADDPYGEVAPPRERLRVAILGASGIGKNHARWFARHSCDVVSFLGSSDESVELTRSHLQAHMGFEGQGYSDLGQLLSETQPQAVCIASPPHLHYAQAIQCLEAGIHVLCEKPLVYTAGRTRRENMDGAKELLKAAAKRDLVLATQLQYGAATPILCRLAGVSPFEVGDFAMEIETTNPKAPRDPKSLWVELAPHPLSVSQYLAGEGAQIIPETLQVVPNRAAYTSEIMARFGVRSVDGRVLMCRIIVRWFDKIVDNREPRRRFSFNGRVVQYSGVKSPDGTYIAQYVAPDGYISHYSDPVDYLIGNFVRTCWQEDELIFSSEQGVENLDWLLTTIEKL